MSLADRVYEIAPQPRSLSGTLTEAEWNALLADREREAQEERDRVEAEAAAAAETARQEALLAEYEASVPDDVRTLSIALAYLRLRLISRPRDHPRNSESACI